MKKVTFSPSGKFYAILREEVQQYFTKQQISPKGDARLYTKTIILFASWLYLYVQLVFFYASIHHFRGIALPTVWFQLGIIGL